MIKSAINKYWVFLYTIAFSPIISFVAIDLLRGGYLKYDSLWFYLFTTTFSVLFMLIIPIALIKKSGKKPEEYGFKFPDNRRLATNTVIITALVSTLLIFLLSKDPSFQKFYLLKHPVNAWFFIEVIISFFYFVSEEFFFRGYLLNKLFEEFGNKAIILSNLLFAVAHLGKPGPEFFFAFFYGIILSLISRKTSSFFPAAIIHFLIALILNLFILYS